MVLYVLVCMCVCVCSSTCVFLVFLCACVSAFVILQQSAHTPWGPNRTLPLPCNKRVHVVCVIFCVRDVRLSLCIIFAAAPLYQREKGRVGAYLHILGFNRTLPLNNSVWLC